MRGETAVQHVSDDNSNACLMLVCSTDWGLLQQRSVIAFKDLPR